MAVKRVTHGWMPGGPCGSIAVMPSKQRKSVAEAARPVASAVEPKPAPTAEPAARWILLIHSLPPKPNYLRVKVGRRLQKLGAIAVKNSVYALPRSDGTREDLQWVAQEIVADGGDAS